MRMRKALTGAAAVLLSIVVVLLAAVGADFGTSIYAEYRLARVVREKAHLGFDPFVAIIAFPLIPQALRHRYDDVEIKATAVDRPAVGKATLEATMHAVDLTESSWLIRPDARLPVGKLESRIIIGSRYVGQFLGVRDLIVEAPTKDTNNATGGTTESGISGSHDLVFTGTPRAAHFYKRVSVAVDLSMAGDDQTTLVFTPTRVLTGPGTADEPVPDDKRDEVLNAFAGRLPDQKLPFGLMPTTEGARGSDVIIEGITSGLTITLDGFNRA
ncbi:mannan chain length control protein LmeA [Candidatus Mycobacterium wuenschmannii]|uniref:Mannan chain length control protein LmeA n=1 Tax=Candidatus Mycobacterium wuenschmannii TaxID=3027808 RepID=A0ABY8VS25_9MYCO|nr:mannan chain length control protein LmeA [Candidatus Mycobacterium wuenschmannii]WIM86131.1 mannan chain length control protein LmeA [Candidatus Mycobacterium wuenschmannii]